MSSMFSCRSTKSAFSLDTASICSFMAKFSSSSATFSWFKESMVPM